MVHTGLKLISKSVAIAARFLTPLFLLFLFIISNVFNLNDLNLSKLIFNGICKNENMDGLGRIVCPIVPIEDPFLNNHELNKDYNIPLLVSTTKLKNGVVLNADSSTPSSLYLIMEVCSTYRANDAKKSTILEDLCVLMDNIVKDSDIKYNFSNNARGNSGSELVKWKNVAALLQRLPNNEKLTHIALLSSLNKNKILGNVFGSILGLNGDYESPERSESPGEGTDLLVTSDILTYSADPFKMLATVAFPNLIYRSFGTIQETMYRLFLSFPEASAALLHMRNLGFDKIDFLSFEPLIDKFTHLAIFLSSFQLLLTYTFDSVSIYTGIVKAAYGTDMVYQKYKYSHLLSEFIEDDESKIFVESIVRSLNTFAINLSVKNKLFMIGDIGFKFTKKLLEILVLMNFPSGNKDGGDKYKIISLKLREGLMHLGKFISFDYDNDGVISFEEYTKATIDLNSFVEDVLSVVNTRNEQKDKFGEGMSGDSGLHFVNLLKSQNSLYDKIIDEFIISDVDRNDILSVEEFIELSLSTCIVENIHT